MGIICLSRCNVERSCFSGIYVGGLVRIQFLFVFLFRVDKFIFIWEEEAREKKQIKKTQGVYLKKKRIEREKE